MNSAIPAAGVWAALEHATLTVKFVLLAMGFMSLTSWSIIFAKLFQLSSAKKQAERDAKRFLEAENLKQAMRDLSQAKSSPAYPVGLAAFEELMRLEEADIDPQEKARVAQENIDRTLQHAVEGELGRLQKKLSFLATCANASPFIGLFGTVWGIMNSFQAIGQMQSAALAAVAPGISEALVATAIGLGVAIPATLAYNFFLNVIQAIERELHTFAAAFQNRIQREVSWGGGTARRKASGAGEV